MANSESGSDMPGSLTTETTGSISAWCQYLYNDQINNSNMLQRKM